MMDCRKEKKMATYNNSENEVMTVTIPIQRYEQLIANETRIIAFNDYYQELKYDPSMGNICSILGIPYKEDSE